MPVQATQMYNHAYKKLMYGVSGGESPTDTVAGTFMWVLVEKTYVPADTHTTGADFTTHVITTGDGAPIDATNLVITDIPGAANESFFQAGTSAGGAGVVQFGPNATITARYLALVKPVTPQSYTSAAELIFYVDLTGSDTNLVSTSGDFTINMHASGWYKMSQT